MKESPVDEKQKPVRFFFLSTVWFGQNIVLPYQAWCFLDFGPSIFFEAFAVGALFKKNMFFLDGRLPGQVSLFLLCFSLVAY